jgi:glutamate N-acetyltransferase/amino-acid N-acetyltransferase
MGKYARSPLAPESLPALPPIAGVNIATAQAGIRYANRTDVLLIALDEGTAVAGVFTRSKAPSAPVDWCRSILGAGSARALIVNSGNANAFTGKRGVVAVEGTVDATCAALGCARNDVWLASTGVIGEPLDHTKIAAVLPALKAGLRGDSWADAAAAIMTTDTFPKAATREVMVGGKMVRINGIAKGSGMIAPDMATMLAFIFTDAQIAAPVLQEMLRTSNAKSFNSITVDGDTSTSDTALLCCGFGISNACVVFHAHISHRRRPFTAHIERVLRRGDELCALCLCLSNQRFQRGNIRRHIISARHLDCC